jgi:hypothetical protein
VNPRIGDSVKRRTGESVRVFKDSLCTAKESLDSFCTRPDQQQGELYFPASGTLNRYDSLSIFNISDGSTSGAICNETKWSSEAQGDRKAHQGYKIARQGDIHPHGAVRQGEF